MPKSKKKADDSETASLSSGSALGGKKGSSTHSLPVLSGTASRPGTAHRPLVLLPAKDLKRIGLSPGDPVLLESQAGRRTVATCDAGGREGGLLFTACILQSLGASEGDQVSLTQDFDVFEASELEVEVAAELKESWPGLVRGLKLDAYLAASLDGSLLLAGDSRTLSLNARPWPLQILACRGAKQHSGAWLVTEGTKLKVSVAAAAKAAQASSKSLGTGGEEQDGFRRVGGLRAVVQELKEAVQLPLERPDLYRQLGVGPPRGVLLYGPPGTGKTLLARSLAEELNCPVELLAATDLVSAGFGESEDRIKAAFDRCRELAEGRGTGALLFIDEIDALCPKRDEASEAERRMVASMLTALDGAKTGDGLVVLGATNRPDAIDPALRRAGRLEREIEVGVPNTEEREQILQVHLAGIRQSLTVQDRKELARRCHGYVGADLRSLCRSAARAALRAGRQEVDLASCIEALPTVPPSALKELLVEVPEVHWGDIGGYEATKEALREAVEWPIKFSWAFEAMRVDPPRGVLLYGPPGCSKTMMAKAVATETEMNFVSIKGPELFSKYVGDSEKAVRDVFRKARTAAPCVVFFDEIDAIGSTREGESSGGVTSRVLAQLLAEMDGIGAVGTRRHVVVLAATNRPHVLDPALTRPGRFDRLVHVPLPDGPAREAIFKAHLGKMRVDEGLEPTTLAERTLGCSGAEVVMVCREAALRAIRDVLDKGSGAMPLATEAHFEEALAAVPPRVTAETVRFYEEFERKMRHV